MNEIEKLYADGDEVIYKPLTWLATTEGQILFTNTISLPVLRDAHSAIRNVPGIFQKRIAKSYEYRITIVDEEIFAVRIFSQDDQEAALDWRRKQMNLRYEVCNPQEFNCDQLHALLKALGLRFGAFDIIETTSGEKIFLEVNPAGNWLWLDWHIRQHDRSGAAPNDDPAKVGSAVESPLDFSCACCGRSRVVVRDVPSGVPAKTAVLAGTSRFSFRRGGLAP